MTVGNHSICSSTWGASRKHGTVNKKPMYVLYKPRNRMIFIVKHEFRSYATVPWRLGRCRYTRILPPRRRPSGPPIGRWTGPMRAICRRSGTPRTHCSAPRPRPATTPGPAHERTMGIRIRNWIRRICMFLGLPDPDPLVRGRDPDLKQNFSKKLNF